ncbi:MAG: SPASM domain-containing protein [Desulfamplus sp.]|nr:SPASM domain-containing protein [Desulfamplus sp.]
MYNYRSRMEISIPPLPYIYEIEPTNHCPYTCIMCPRGTGKMARPTGYMNLDDFARVLSMFPQEQRVVRLHHFGEAILHPQIDTMIKMVEREGLVSVISLNPATLSEKLSRRIVDAGPGIVCFSLDAFTDSGLVKVRGIRKTYHKCIELMDSFIKLARNSDRSIVKVIQTVALDENSSVLHGTQSGSADDLHDTRSDSAGDLHGTRSGNADNSKSSCCITQKALDELKTKYPEPDVFFYSADNTGFGDLELVEKTKTGGSKLLVKNASPCAAPFSEVSVLWNGDVVLCCYDYDGFNVVGNIRDNTIEEIWKGSRIDRVRKIFIARSTDRLTLCSRCFLAPHNFSEKIALCEKNWREERVLIDLTLNAKAL